MAATFTRCGDKLSVKIYGCPQLREKAKGGGKGDREKGDCGKQKTKVTNATCLCLYDRNLVFGYAGGRIRYGTGKLERDFP